VRCSTKGPKQVVSSSALTIYSTFHFILTNVPISGNGNRICPSRACMHRVQNEGPRRSVPSGMRSRRVVILMMHTYERLQRLNQRRSRAVLTCVTLHWTQPMSGGVATSDNLRLAMACCNVYTLYTLYYIYIYIYIYIVSSHLVSTHCYESIQQIYFATDESLRLFISSLQHKAPYFLVFA